LAIGFLDFDPAIQVVFSRLGQNPVMSSGDSDAYAKILITAPGKPVVDLEVNSNDAFPSASFKVLGTKGTFQSTFSDWKLKYIVDGENPERPVIDTFLEDENRNPAYCREDLIKHTEEGDFIGDAFTVGTPALYEQLYFKLTEGRPMDVTAEMAAEVISVIETAHANNPMSVEF
jgi:hypothetical protein